MKIISFLLFSLISTSVVAAQNSPLIYRPNSIGSDSTFNPVSYYFNLAFDTTQNPYYFTQSNYFANHDVLWQRVSNPFRTIEDSGGYGTFITSEIAGLRAVPNYTLHLLGGGYDYRWMSEWYEARGVPYPYVVAFVSAYLANIGNEALETSASQVGPFDNIADLYLFDIIGKLLFLNDDVVHFMHDTLEMRAWHFQPMFNMRNRHVDNAGANYVFRPELFGPKVRPFIFIGMTVMAGASFQIQGEDSLSTAVGLALTDPLVLKGDPIAGIFWDRKDSLLASLVINGSSNLAFRLNLYPDFISVSNVKIGYYLAHAKSGETYIGCNFNMPIGASLFF